MKHNGRDHAPFWQAANGLFALVVELFFIRHRGFFSFTSRFHFHWLQREMHSQLSRFCSLTITIIGLSKLQEWRKPPCCMKGTPPASWIPFVPKVHKAPTAPSARTALHTPWLAPEHRRQCLACVKAIPLSQVWGCSHCSLVKWPKKKDHCPQRIWAGGQLWMLSQRRKMGPLHKDSCQREHQKSLAALLAF